MFTLTTPRLGEILLETGAITAEQLAEGVEIQSLTHVRLGSILVANNWVTEEQITQAVSVQLNMNYIDIANADLDWNCVALIPNEIAKRYQLLPLSVYENEDDQKPMIRVGMVNPWDIEAIDLIQRISWHRVEPVLASKAGMAVALEKAYQLAEESHVEVDHRLHQGDTRVMLRQMLENSIQQARQNLAELESIQKYVNTV